MEIKMENEKNKRKRQRSENWLEEDKNLLMDLVKERMSIIENKNTDTNTNTKKLAAWTNLLTRFNTLCKGGIRSVPQLKSQWSIIKMTNKKVKSEERKKLLQTGGGPPPPTNPENADDIYSWLPNEFVIDIKKTSSLKKCKIKENMSKVSAAENIAAMETACRKELHEAKMDNELKKARNLDLEEALLKLKMELIKKKIESVENCNCKK